MRDPNRIYKFCNELAEIWHDNCPDWRFGQFISNVMGAWQGETQRDIFFPEDEVFMAYFRKYFNVEEKK